MAKSLSSDPERYALVEDLVALGKTPAEIQRITSVTPPVVIKYFPEAGAIVPTGDWKDVVGWPEYAVTSSGLIKANRKVSHSGRNLRERLLKPVTHPAYGHQLVYLTRGGKTVTRQLGRLILETFDGPPADPSHECRHLDGNPQNNSISNLKWGTHAENMQDMVRHGSRKQSTCVRGHSFEGGNIKYDSRGHRGCRSCSLAHERASREGREFSREEADEIYKSYLSTGRPSPTQAQKEREAEVRGLTSAGASLSEIKRTTGADYRTVRRIDPDYRPFEVGGGGDAAVIRQTNQQLQEFLRRGKIGKHRENGFRPKE